MTIETLPPEHQDLVQQVQYNCDISDANHAGNFTLCIYLLKMREYYRWIQALDYADSLDSERMGQWLRDKEETWDQVVDNPFRPLHWDGQEFDPFDHAALNQKINAEALFYHAGIGQKSAQHFFISDLIDQRQHQNRHIYITGIEYARDLTAPPAISTADSIVIRRQSLQRMCWERYQEWNWSRLDNPMGKALSFYPFDTSIPDALAQMVDRELETLIQHELGELWISDQYGADWRGMMLGLLGTRAELMARAVRDHLADSLTTLPFLVAQNDPASLHFYFANLTAMRKELFPSAMRTYQRWQKDEDNKVLLDLAQESTAHWQPLLESIVAISQTSEQNAAAEICQAIDNAKL